MLKFKTIICMLLTNILVMHNLHSEETPFIVNKTKPVALASLKDLYSAWTILKIDYPNAKAVYLYSGGKVDFCVFELNQDNKFVLYISPDNLKEIKFNVDGKDAFMRFKVCYFAYSSVEEGQSTSQEARKEPFGLTFWRVPNESCELKYEGTFNGGGIFNAVLSCDKSGIWSGSIISKVIK